MTRFHLALLLAGGMMLGLSAPPALAFHCPADMAQIDEALQTAELSEEQQQRVQELRAEGERHHQEGQHQAAVGTLADANEIRDIE